MANPAFFLPAYGMELQAEPLLVFDLGGFWLFHAAAWGLLAFLALRYPNTVAHDAQAATRVRLTSLALYPAFFAAPETVASRGRRSADERVHLAEVAE